MLKFENQFQIGDMIKVYTLPKRTGIPDRCVIGQVLRIHDDWQGKFYIIEVTEETGWMDAEEEKECSMMGEEYWVPMEIWRDFDYRITLYEPK